MSGQVPRLTMTVIFRQRQSQWVSNQVTDKYQVKYQEVREYL